MWVRTVLASGIHAENGYLTMARRSKPPCLSCRLAASIDGPRHRPPVGRARQTGLERTACCRSACRRLVVPSTAGTWTQGQWRMTPCGGRGRAAAAVLSCPGPGIALAALQESHRLLCHCFACAAITITITITITISHGRRPPVTWPSTALAHPPLARPNRSQILSPVDALSRPVHTYAVRQSP